MRERQSRSFHRTMVDQDHATETVTAVERMVQKRFDLPERWRLERVLGAGGQGAVWLAFDSDLQERVAIKVLTRPDSPTAVERLKREVRLGRRIRHPNLVQIYELVDAGQSMAVVMEYLEGGSLSSRLQDGQMEISTIVTIAEALLAGLSCLHRQGIVHRDVKPSNVLFDGSGVPKLADFGTVKPITEKSDLTLTRGTVGTPAYMSPEQIRGKDPGPPSDLYSLGVTLYHLLAGRRPFEGGSEFDLARRQVTDSVPSLRRERADCPRWLARFVLRLLEKEPIDRWRDAGEALRAFRSRRWHPSRRSVIRGTAAATLLMTIGVVVSVGIDRFSGLQSSVENGELVVRNTMGRTMWRRPIEGVTPHSLVLDLHEERGPEILTAAEVPEGSSAYLELLLFGRSKLLDRFRIRSPISDIVDYFPTLNEKWNIRKLNSVDFGGEVGRAAVWTVINREWYPSIVGLWTKRGPRPLFVNSGHISEAAAIDIDHDGRRELLIAGFNNILGNQLFATVIDLSRPDDCSPDLWKGEGKIYRTRAATAYVLLGEVKKNETSGLTLSLDRDGRPFLRSARRKFPIGADGVIDGVSGNQTIPFWVDIATAAMEFRTGRNAWHPVINTLSEKHRALWSRPSFRAGAALMLADALAEGGRPARGAGLLDSVIESGAEMRRLLRKTGELRLLSGDRDRGHTDLMQAVGAYGRGFSSQDVLIDLALDSALHQDLVSWQEVSGLLQSSSYLDTCKEMQLAVDFFGGRFAECGVALPARSGALYDVQVLRIWAEIETGTYYADINKKLDRLAGRRECAELALIARARALTLEGKADEVVGPAVEALEVLRMRAARSWPDAVMLPLAEWAVGTMYRATGAEDRARPHLEFAATRAPRTFFGRDAARLVGK